MLLDFSPFESSWLLSFWILIQPPLSIVSFCVRYILILTHWQRITLEISFTLMWFSMCFWYILLFRSFWLSLAFCLSIYGMGSFKYNTLFTLLGFPWEFCCYPLGKLLMWDEWSLKIALWNFLYWVISQVLIKNSMCS